MTPSLIQFIVYHCFLYLPITRETKFGNNQNTNRRQKVKVSGSPLNVFFSVIIPESRSRQHYHIVSAVVSLQPLKH